VREKRRAGKIIMKNILVCPVCGEELAVAGKSRVCGNGHCFDVSKYGYVNLLLPDKKNSADPGDNKEMIKARVAVMKKGYYEALAKRIAEILTDAPKPAFLDAGCGVGYVPHILKTSFSDAEVWGTDISKFAIEYASRAYKGANYAVCSSLRLPFISGAFGAVVCAFAPVYPAEFARVNSDNGLFIRVQPAPGHLYGLKKLLYDVPRLNDRESETIDGYEFLREETVVSEFSGTKEDFSQLVKMTPYYYHTPRENLARLDAIEGIFTTDTEFSVRVYKRGNANA
jgi:23S rRNA (guanine745-N1)-methyltransferase